MYRGKAINYKIVTFLIVFLTIFLVFSGCTSQKSTFIGKWQEIGGTETLEFFSDNRVALSDKGLTITGDWNILDDGRVKVELPVAGVTFSATGKIEGSILYLTEQNGDVSKYQKLTATTLLPGGNYKTVVNGYTIAYEIVNGKVNIHAIEGKPALKISTNDLENKINSLITSGHSSEQAINEAVQSLKAT